MNRRWEPKFDGWSEDRVFMSPCELATHASSRNEYGVVVQENEDGQPPSDAAIFWTDETHLYLRYDWGTWYRISNDDPAVCSNICRRSSATLFLASGAAAKNHTVKVHRIGELPEELFGSREQEAPDAHGPTQLDLGLCMPAADAGGEEETPESREIDGSAFLFSLIAGMGGRHIAQYATEPHLFDFFELNGSFIAASYFCRCGGWMANEEAEDGDTPVWLGAKGIAVSPVATANKIRAALAPVGPAIQPIISIVLVGPGCRIMNETDYFGNRKDISIRLVRRQEARGSMLEAAETVLKRITGGSRPELAGYAPAIRHALASVFAANP